jgi:hypothetical protein
MMRPSAVQTMCSNSERVGAAGASFLKAVIASTMIWGVGRLSLWVRAVAARVEELERLLT